MHALMWFVLAALVCSALVGFCWSWHGTRQAVRPFVLLTIVLLVVYVFTPNVAQAKPVAYADNTIGGLIILGDTKGVCTIGYRYVVTNVKEIVIDGGCWWMPVDNTIIHYSDSGATGSWNAVDFRRNPK